MACPKSPQEPRVHPSRLLLFIIATLVLVGAAGATGYFLGRMQGQAPIPQATLRASVQNHFAYPISVQLLVNGKAKRTVSIPAFGVASVDLPVTFTGPDGAYFQVSAVAVTQPGNNDSGTVLVNSPGIYVVSFNLG